MNRPTTKTHSPGCPVRHGQALELGRLPDGELLARPEHGREEGGDKRHLLPRARGWEARTQGPANAGLEVFSGKMNQIGN